MEESVKELTIEKIRNLAVISHSGVGKTSLVEAFAFIQGSTNRLGKVEDGTTISDYHPDEIERKISITTSLINLDWSGHKINLLDTPGYSDFIGEVIGALRVVETSLVLVNAVSGIEVGTEQVLMAAEDVKSVKIGFVNQLNKEHANFDKVLSSLQENYGTGVVAIQFPANSGENFNRFVDLLEMKLVTYESGGSGKRSKSDIPEELQDKANELREKLIESAAESDDTLLEKFFDAGELTNDEITQGLRTGVVNGNIFPVLCGAATENIGTHELLDFIVNFAPSPADVKEFKSTNANTGDEVSLPATADSSLATLVFKTESEPHVGEFSIFRVYGGSIKVGDDVYNANRKSNEKIGQIYSINGHNRKEVNEVGAGDIGAVVKLKNTHTGDTLCIKNNPLKLETINYPSPSIRAAVVTKSKGDEEKISTGLTTLHEEDPTFVAGYDPELRQTIIQGQGELHLAVILKRLKEKFGVEVDLVEPKIPYRETIKGTAQTQYKHKKQSGGRGQYGEVYVKIEPQKRGDGYEFVDAIVGGVIPSKFIPAVDKGIKESMVEGPLAGYTVVDLKMTLYDGSYHSVDSSDMAFKIAGSMAFKKAFMEAKPLLLEPIYDVIVRVPEDYLGDVMGDLSSRRGKIMGIDTEGHFQIINAKVPLAELYRYSTSLRSLTQGRGLHRRKVSHYEEVPGDVAEKVIQAAKEAKESEK